MRSLRAVAILTIPLALTWMLLLGVMCLTPYWTCKVDLSVPFTVAWKPMLFVAVVLSIVAVLVLSVDLLVVQLFPPTGYRSVGLAVAGGAIATIPRILWDLRDGTFAEAFTPQLEFLPFALAGAIFIIILAKLTGGGGGEKQSMRS